jgi:hypothetical protein
MQQAECAPRSGFLRAGLLLALSFLTAGGAGAVGPAPLPDMSPKEEYADKVWQLRAGLNVAALQCQFSPFLATVPTYNALLRQHSDEMAAAFKMMTSYFVRTKGPKLGQRAFDSYATRTNQSWATFDAQVPFCNAAALSGRRSLGVPKGQLGDFAMIELGSLRDSTASAPPQTLAPRLEWAIVPVLTDPCQGRSRCR